METNVYCKECNEAIFKIAPLDENKPDGPKGTLGKPEFKQTPEGNYFICPHCQTKNMTKRSRSY